MRIIAKSTLINYIHQKKYILAKQQILSWYSEVENALWDSTAELKIQFCNASIITDKRVVFNIKGNDFRLIVDIEYRLKIVFIVWFGTHKEYDQIDVKNLNFKRN